MKLNLNFLADHLAEFEPCAFMHDIPIDSAIRNIFTMRKDTACVVDYAYLLDGADIAWLDHCDRDAILNYVIFGKDYPDIGRLSPQWNILFLHTGSSRAAIKDCLQKFLAEYIIWYDSLSDAVMSDAPLQKQLDRAAEMLKNPIALYDVSYFLLGYAGHVPQKTEDKIWPFAISHGYALESNIPVQFRERLNKQLNDHVPNVVPSLEEEGLHIIVAPLCHDGKQIGFLAMDDILAPFTRGEQSVVYLVKCLLEYSPAFLRELSLYGSGTSHILTKLLAGEYIRADALSHMAEHYHWHNGEKYRVWIAVPSWNEGLDEAMAAAYERKIRMNYPAFSVFYAKNRLVLIEHQASQVSPKVLTFSNMDKDALWYGVSMIYERYEYLPAAARQASMAAGSVSREYPIISFEADWRRQLLGKLGSSENLLAYCHPVLLKFHMENEWERELFHTLQIFLDKDLHPTETAKALHVHRNTLLNRLRRTEELLDIHFEDMDEDLREHLIVSCSLYGHLHR